MSILTLGLATFRLPGMSTARPSKVKPDSLPECREGAEAVSAFMDAMKLMIVPSDKEKTPEPKQGKKRVLPAKG